MWLTKVNICSSGSVLCKFALVQKFMLWSWTITIAVVVVHSYGLRRRMQPSSLLDVWNVMRIELQGPGT